MYKYKLLLVVLMANVAAFAQVPGVGINTANPQGIFNIDGGKDNPTTGSGHTTAQQANDFTVLTNGNVGIGTIAPTQDLHIEGNTRMNGNIYDGINAAGAIGQVLSSDGNEVIWVQNLSVTPTVLGVMPGVNVPINNLNEYVYLQAYITLPPGSWVVPTGSVARTDFRIGVDGQLLVKYYLSDSDATFTQTADLNTSAGAYNGAGSVTRGGNFGMVYGDFIIDNTSGANKTYYLWGLAENAGATVTQRIVTVFGGNSHERWLYAMPIPY